MSDAWMQLERDFVSDLEMLASALSASLSITQALALMSARASESWRESFKFVYEKTEQLGLQAAITLAKREIKDHRFDLLLELLGVEARFGSTNLQTVLSNQAQRLRKSFAVRILAHEKIQAVKGVARIAISAPWLVLLVISSKPENLDAFMSLSGFGVLFMGFASCALAWMLMSRMARLPEPRRVLSS